jgi:hypothetical protein
MSGEDKDTLKESVSKTIDPKVREAINLALTDLETIKSVSRKGETLQEKRR